MTKHSRTRTGFCGIDVGTQGVRAVVVDEAGEQLGIGACPLGQDRRKGAVHEQDPDEWWVALVTAVRAAVDPLGETDIVAVALDATSGTVLLEDSSGTATGPALMYDDTRAVEQAGRAALHGASLWDELGYRMQATWGLPKAMWLVEQDTLSAGDRVVHQSDHLARRLVGHAVPTETSSALKTGVDLRSASWPVELFAGLGLPVVRLPEVVLPGTPVGTVGDAAAAATGLPRTAVVRAGMTDGCAAQIASGALHPGQWSSALGTTLVLKGTTPSLVRDPDGAVYCHRHPDGGWLPGGASSSGAGILRDLFPGADPDELARLTRQAAQQQPVAGATYPLSGQGERFPFVAATARGFTSPEARTSTELFSAVCHGVAYVERLAYDVLAALGADVSGTVAFSGGASANGWWNQLRTDVLGRTALVAQSTDAATGMAILAAAAPGDLTATADRMVKVIETLSPDPGRGGELRSGYEDLVAALVDRGWLDGSVANRALQSGQARS